MRAIYCRSLLFLLCLAAFALIEIAGVARQAPAAGRAPGAVGVASAPA